jgi:hypothetical protein
MTVLKRLAATHDQRHGRSVGLQQRDFGQRVAIDDDPVGIGAQDDRCDLTLQLGWSQMEEVAAAEVIDWDYRLAAILCE